ncbi:putative membrane protein insertion efficiency factor [Caldicoprobacter guelmensis]|nr:putative membrane protein insertion efficiency factor [Caldicoprobacter guelmensis]
MVTMLMRSLLVGIIRCYQRSISPLLPNSCRFYPTCSEYVVQAVEKYGVLKGLFMGIKRVLKCHPFHPGGYDPLE